MNELKAVKGLMHINIVQSARQFDMHRKAFLFFNADEVSQEAYATDV